MNDYINNYYQIMNILDDVAMNNKPLDMQTIYQLQNLASEEGIVIEDIADANDCGECHNWKELVDCLREQFANGERIPIDSVEDIYSDYISSDTDIIEIDADGIYMQFGLDGALYSYQTKTQYEDPAIAVDIISDADKEEILHYVNNPNDAFDGSGICEVFNTNTRNCEIYYGYDEIINSVLSDSSIAKFMDNLVFYNNSILSDLYEYMVDRIVGNSTDELFIEEVESVIYDEPKSFADKCSWYIECI